MRRPRRSNTALPFKPGVEQGYPVLLAEATAQGADRRWALTQHELAVRRHSRRSICLATSLKPMEGPFGALIFPDAAT